MGLFPKLLTLVSTTSTAYGPIIAPLAENLKTNYHANNDIYITVEGNDFSENNPGGASQAYDNNKSNSFVNNYWSDHTSPDSDDKAHPLALLSQLEQRLL